ncbi:hypothetical protein VNO78_31246 [Psophocarpus tetragonolobus]|uniref:Purple acid phosphatase n=1 Tax=Psophocarpus tetragonolobus TaxID=3891 RepID=A0AAN9RZZ8_PSOTE
MMGSRVCVLGFLLLIIFGILELDAVYGYRPPPRRTFFVPDADNPGSPQQVHISQVGEDRMRISWITKKSTAAEVTYGLSPAANTSSAKGITSSYSFLFYKSNHIHHAVIGPLNPNTVYYYRLGDPSSSKTFSFKTTPSKLPIKFAVIGDIGQTEITKSILDNVAKSNYDMLLLPGDLSYADLHQTLWDNFGRLVEALASKRPWMVTQGNHEVEKILLLHSKRFTAYNARWRMPFEESGSDSNLYYSFNVAGVHVLMLASYADFESSSPQYKWLQNDLRKLNRKITPWLLAVIHAPWYNSNKAHPHDHESVNMKKAMEELLYKSRVDIVFAGHVHAYERFTRVYKDKPDDCGPVYITIGGGGNREGLATQFKEPKPSISMFREASFGYGAFQVFNASHALWTWHKNGNDANEISDSAWLNSLSSNRTCKK